jgi:hypothetical protein
MSKGYLNNWIRMCLLLGALAAGTLATQLVPQYHEQTRTVTYPSKAASMTNAAGHSQSVSGVEVDEQHLTLVRTKS